MNSTIKKHFLKESSNWKFWLLLAFIAKLAFFIFKIKEAHVPYMVDGFWGGNNGDTWWYLAPIDNLLKNGNYLPDFRLPGYGTFYLPFRFFFSAATACNMLIIFQLLLASISVYVLALIAKSVFKNDGFFYATFYLFAISTYSNIADTHLMPESPTPSMLIFSVYFFIKYFTDYIKKNLLISGFFMAWVIFLRPENVLFIIFFYLILVADCIKNKRKFVVTLLFLMPFTVFDSIWIAHNYKTHKKIIPLSSVVPIKDNTYPCPADITDLYPLISFIRSWGGNLCWWEPKAEIRWFCVNWNDESIPTDSNKVDVTIPDYIYTSKFNKDSLANLRKIFILLGDIDSTMTVIQRIKYIQYISKKFDLYTKSVQDEKPFLYYVKAPLILTKTFIINGNECTNNNWFLDFIPRLSQKYYYIEYPLQLFYSIFYILTMTFGIIGIFLLSKNIFKFSIMAIIPLISAAAFLINPVIMHLSEGRHLIPYFPFILVCAIYTVYWILNVFKSLKHKANK